MEYAPRLTLRCTKECDRLVSHLCCLHGGCADLQAMSQLGTVLSEQDHIISSPTAWHLQNSTLGIPYAPKHCFVRLGFCELRCMSSGPVCWISLASQSILKRCKHRRQRRRHNLITFAAFLVDLPSLVLTRKTASLASVTTLHLTYASQPQPYCLSITTGMGARLSPMEALSKSQDPERNNPCQDKQDSKTLDSVPFAPCKHPPGRACQQQ